MLSIYRQFFHIVKCVSDMCSKDVFLVDWFVMFNYIDLIRWSVEVAMLRTLWFEKKTLKENWSYCLLCWINGNGHRACKYQKKSCLIYIDIYGRLNKVKQEHNFNSFTSDVRTKQFIISKLNRHFKIQTI